MTIYWGENPESLQQHLYQNKSAYQTMAENAKKMSEEMNWETEAKKLLEIYHSVYRIVEDRRK